MFNCSLIGTDGFVDCSDLNRDHMATMYQQAFGIEAIVRMTYTMAVIGARLEHNLGGNTRLAWYVTINRLCTIVYIVYTVLRGSPLKSLPSLQLAI